MRLSTFIALATLTPLTNLAGENKEYTVEPKPFKIETSLNAVFLPTKSHPILIKPEHWTDFTVTSLVPQGTTVKKGETLIGIDTRAIDKHIAASEEARKSAAHNLAQAKHDLAQLEITTPRTLEAYALAEKEATENLTWYTEIGHPKEIEQTKRAVKLAEEILAYQQEELKQLEKMYAEDNKTEETEEIILIRSRNSVARAAFNLKVAKIDADHTLNTAIPRKLEATKRAARDAKNANASAKENLPRALKLKRLAVAKAIHNDSEAAKNLTKLKADRAIMDITAPADGSIYYGSIKHGRWSPNGAVKVLRIGSKLPANMTLMTFIPANTPLTLSAFTSENSLAHLTPKATGYAISNLDRYQSFPVTLTSVATKPETDGSYRVALKPTTPASLKLVPGMKATARIITHKTDKALKIPSGHLTRSDNGTYTVKIKLANGKTSTRTVTTGPSNKEWVIITQGLEQGQVIVK